MGKRKSKKNRNLLTIMIVTVIGIMTASIVMAGMLTKKSQPSTHSTSRPIVASEELSVNAWYHTRHRQNPDSYWLEGNEDPETFIRKVKMWSEKTRGLLAQFSDVSPLAETIYREFREFRVSEFYQGASQSFHNGDAEEQDMQKLMSQLEVCVVTRYWGERFTFPSRLYYRAEWGAVMVLGVDIPDNFLAALMFHEMGHAYKHRVEHAPSAMAPAGTDAYIEEEVLMHDLKSLVLNAATGGAYFELYESIRLRNGEVGDLRTILNSIRKEDIAAYETLFGLEKAGPGMAAIYLGQFYIGLGLYVVDKTIPEKDRMTAKIRAYRATTTK